jgi:hypothetical protein
MAGGQIAQGRAQAGYANAFANGLGVFGGLGGFNSAPPVIDGGYSMGLGSAYGGQRAGL